jgi:hypothetical protein
MPDPSSVPIIRYDLAHFGVVTQVISATQFVAAGLGAYPNGTFVGYFVWPLSKVDGSINPPKGEPPSPISAFVGSRAILPTVPGTVTHTAFTALLSVGDAVLLLHPSIAAAFSGGSGITPARGTVTANWQAAETNLISLGTAGVARKVNYLGVGIQNLAGNISIRMYMMNNGVEYRFYPNPAGLTFNPLANAPVIPVIGGTMGIFGLLRVTLQSDNGADNGVAVTYEAN